MTIEYLNDAPMELRSKGAVWGFLFATIFASVFVVVGFVVVKSGRRKSIY